MLLSAGDFEQTLLAIPKVTRADAVQKCLLTAIACVKELKKTSPLIRYTLLDNQR